MSEPWEEAAPNRRALILRIVFAAAIPLLALALPSPAEGPGPITVLPPLLAIALAFATRSTVLPLFGGVWLGAAMIAYRDGGGFFSPVKGLVSAVDRFIIRTAFYDPGGAWFSGGGEWKSFNLSVIGFVFALVGMVALTIRGGGMAGVAERFVVLAKSARATRITTWLLGLVIFFDDYANTLIVGGTMRPLTDRMRVSREKLAWLVDSTAAPVAGLSLLSTWVAYEVSQFAPQLPPELFPGGESAGYNVFIQTLPYRFYCLLTLFFVGAMSFMSRDYGPMLAAERRARSTGAVFRPGSRPMSGDDEAAQPKDDIPHRAHVAFVPVSVTLLSIAVLFFVDARGALGEAMPTTLSMASVRAVLGAVENNTLMLFYGSAIGLAVALALTVGEKLLTPREAASAASSGTRAMFLAVTILVLAWAMSEVCGALGTRDYMTSMAPLIPPVMLPAGLFVLGCLIAFATGSSWSTMGILLPIVVGLAAEVGAGTTLGATGMVIVTIGAVLDGSIFGDHCSPISDTTILSSTAAGSDHMDHVRTQAPYALTVCAVALLIGYLPAAAGVSVWLLLPAGAAALVLIARVFGRRLHD
ncbi:MAG: Na+/H+ antiporter NhaC family protein [Deltaproteobacteria bacterium]|nr:Na+/H+ antiporter NhaC family protein [Deltaproteobacteria bacterium]